MTTNPREIILVDMDGVLADFDGPLFEEFADELDITYPTQQVHRFLTDHLATSADKRSMRALVESPGWFRDLPLIDGAQEGIEAIQRQGWDVWICSKPLEASPTCASEKFAWVKEHFPGLVGKLILAPNKGLVRGRYLIDDAPKGEWLTYASWEPIIYTHPWNLNHFPHEFRGTWDTIPYLLEVFA